MTALWIAWGVLIASVAGWLAWDRCRPVKFGPAMSGPVRAPRRDRMRAWLRDVFGGEVEIPRDGLPLDDWELVRCHDIEARLKAGDTAPEHHYPKRRQEEL